MPWRNHAVEIVEALRALYSYPTETIMAATSGALARIKSVKAAAVVLAGAVGLGISVGVASVTILGGLLDAPAEIQEVQRQVTQTQDRLDRVEGDMDAILSRLDSLICELREERTGQTPADCERRILF